MIIDPLQQYVHYTVMAEVMNLKNFSECCRDLKKYTFGKIVACNHHLDYKSRLLVGVRLTDGTEIIINVEGIEYFKGD